MRENLRRPDDVMGFNALGRTRIAALADRTALGRRAGVVVSMTALVTASCGTAAVYQVQEGTYLSVVPSEEQFGVDADGALPGGVAQLRKEGVDRIEVDITGDQVLFRLDGTDTEALGIVERIDITDRAGSGPFTAKKQLLVLADTLVLGELVIDQPVIWPGSFEDSPVITIKPRTPDERGPGVSCRADEPCLILSAGVDPDGRYADANNPEFDNNPIDSILIEESIDITLDTGKHVRFPAANGSFVQACGLSENRVWDLPTELGLDINDPVLVHTLCPSTPGAAIQLIIMDRSAVPLLAPLTEEREGDWCAPGPDCLLFVPE